MQLKANKIVIHGTAGSTASGAIAYMKKCGLGVHYVIDQNGQLITMIQQDDVCYHAGANFRNVSQTSFSIEIVN